MRRLALAALGVLLAGAAAAAGGKSLYQAPLQWTTDAGKSARLADWKGRPVVLTMLFTSCRATCPLTIAQLKAIQAKFDREGIAADVVIVSFDPARDTPEHLARFRAESGLTNPNWTFLVGSDEATRTLAMLLGIKYSRNPLSGDIMHDNKIVLLDGEGAITSELLGLDAPLDDFHPAPPPTP